MSANVPIQPVNRKIVIEKTTGKGGRDLQHCYFLPTGVPGFYNFYSQQGQLLASDVESGKNFDFELDDIQWDVHQFQIDKFTASGDWSNNAPVPAEEQDGTFQAQAGGGVPTGVEENVLSDTAPAGAIEIKTVTGGGDKDKLKKCYFVADGSVYDFYSKDGTELASGLTSGNDFQFTYDSINWTISNFVISSTAASGHWSVPDITAEQDGTFQAQAGGSADEDASASAASA